LSRATASAVYCGSGRSETTSWKTGSSRSVRTLNANPISALAGRARSSPAFASVRVRAPASLQIVVLPIPASPLKSRPASPNMTCGRTGRWPAARVPARGVPPPSHEHDRCKVHGLCPGPRTRSSKFQPLLKNPRIVWIYRLPTSGQSSAPA
jgi:hypothetical protein